MKLSILLFIFTAIFLKIYSQSSSLLIGFHLSPIISSLREERDLADYKTSLRWSTGINIEYYLTQNISLKSGISFERIGAKGNIMTTDMYGVIIKAEKAESFCDYLIIPILASLTTNSKLKIYFNSGPFIGILINQRFPTFDNINHLSFSAVEEMKGFNIGLSFGLGLNILISQNSTIDLGFRDNYGMYNIQKSENYLNTSTKSNTIGLEIAFKYRL